MIIVGLSHPISRNTAACILIDGRLIAMAEEERFIRIKHANRIFPKQALEFCLNEAEISLQDVDYFAIGHGKPLSALRNVRFREPITGFRYLKKQYLDIQNNEKKLNDLFEKCDKHKFIFVRHHIAHAASSFFASGFQEAIIISLDGSGDSESGLLAVGRGNELKIYHTISNAESWGKAYEYVTEALGFQYNSQEGKTMGLAPYGTPDLDILPFINWKRKIPTINYKRRIKFFNSISQKSKDSPFSAHHKNMAATMQFALEKAASSMAELMFQKTGIRKLCLAGGTTLNCSMNGKLAELPWVDDIFVQPAAHDAGSALGAVLFAYTNITRNRSKWHMNHAYWGPQYDNKAIENALHEFEGIEVEFCKDICSVAASKLAQGYIIGWFQGRLEVGPRALGNRSILGDPSRPEMKDLINLKVKNREAWRPFAPAILEDKMSRYFDRQVNSPFMILAFETKLSTRYEIISATHIDGTARPQSVSKATNPIFWNLLSEFENRTGIPALLSTSFNVAGQPIVNSPQQAIKIFLECGMDYLAVGDFMVKKSR